MLKSSRKTSWFSGRSVERAANVATLKQRTARDANDRRVKECIRPVCASQMEQVTKAKTTTQERCKNRHATPESRIHTTLYVKQRMRVRRTLPLWTRSRSLSPEKKAYPTTFHSGRIQERGCDALVIFPSGLSNILASASALFPLCIIPKSWPGKEESHPFRADCCLVLW